MKDDSKQKARAYSQSRVRGGAYLKVLFLFLALCFVVVLIALGTKKQPLGKLLVLPKFAIFKHRCYDPLTGKEVKCGEVIESGPGGEFARLGDARQNCISSHSAWIHWEPESRALMMS